MASNFELDLLRLAIAFDACRCNQTRPKKIGMLLAKDVQFKVTLTNRFRSEVKGDLFFWKCRRQVFGWWVGKDIQEASFRRQISMNCLISETSLGMVAVFPGGEESWEVGGDVVDEF